MAKKSSSESKKSCCWGLCLWGWFSKVAIIATVTAVTALFVWLIVELTHILLPALGYILAAIIAYFILLREEFKGFREAFRNKYCFLEISRAFLCCSAHTLKKCCPCNAPQGLCCLPSCCCWKSTSCTSEAATKENNVATTKTKKTVKKAPAKKEGAS